MRIAIDTGGTFGEHRGLHAVLLREPRERTHAGRSAGTARASAVHLASHRILPDFREYERASTVVANAYVAPKVGSYISALEAAVREQYPQERLEVMQSSGGVIAAYKLAALPGFDHILGFDMGAPPLTCAWWTRVDHASAMSR